MDLKMVVLPEVRLRHMEYKIFGAKIFGELRNVALEENGEDKMIRERN